jgi:hypothetical protein
MSADKRTVSTDALETLGTIIGPNEKRDAIHLAVIPVEAGEDIFPSQHVFLRDGRAFCMKGCAIGERPGFLGIADPFLNGPVKEGQHFWLVIYPRVITSLRHVWTHPELPDEAGTAAVTRDVAASEAWLRAFVATADCPDYHTLIGKALNNDSWSEEYLHFDGLDAHGEIPPEFWDHVEIVTGQKITSRAKYFSCSC